MFRLTFIMAFSFLALQAQAACAETPSDRLIAALIQVESKGNDRAHGDLHMKQQAYGPLQIRQPVCDDINRRFGTNHHAEDCLGNRALSVELCKQYLSMYATEKRLGREVTDEDRARIWNGGPQGFKKSSTEKYWDKVQAVLKE
jgi:hypothetical protein